MFEQKTVFVIGAGASHEIGMPLGEGLKGRISEFLRWDRSYSGGLREMCKRGLPDSTGFREAALAIVEGLPNAISIDNFLHTHAKNEMIVRVGKIAIVKCIIDSERESDFLKFRMGRVLLTEMTILIFLFLGMMCFSKWHVRGFLLIMLKLYLIM